MKKELVHPELPKMDIVIRETLIDDNNVIEKERLISIPQIVLEDDNENKKCIEQSK